LNIPNLNVLEPQMSDACYILATMFALLERGCLRQMF